MFVVMCHDKNCDAVPKQTEMFRNRRRVAPPRAQPKRIATLSDVFWTKVAAGAPTPTGHPLTVVITAFRRPRKLIECVQSVTAVFNGPLVISSSGTTQDVTNALHAIVQAHPHVTVVATPTDHNCNETWIRGVYQVRTPYVLILHDDDVLEPQFKDVYTGVFRPMMDSGETDLFLWPGLIRPSNGQAPTRTHTFDHVVNRTSTGFVGDSSADVLARYRKEKYPITPVVQIYRRDVALQALVECADRFTSFVHFSRPGMMLGNEIMMTTRSLQLHGGRARVYYYRDRPLTGLGYWPESETVRFKGNEDLLRGYRLAHEYAVANPTPVPTVPRLVVAISAYPAARGSTDMARNLASFSSWTGAQDMVPAIQVVYVHDRDLERQDSRVPHLDDVLGVARSLALPTDVVALCNSDILVTSDFWEKVFPVCLQYGAAFSYRKNYGETERPAPNLHSTQLRSMEQDRRGADLFCFTVKFYDDVVKPAFPDMLLGRVSWDWAMRALLECKAADGSLETPKPLLGHRVEVSGVTYHQRHESRWLTNTSTRTGNRMNLEATRDLLIRLAPNGRLPEPVAKELTSLFSLCG